MQRHQSVGVSNFYRRRMQEGGAAGSRNHQIRDGEPVSAGRPNRSFPSAEAGRAGRPRTADQREVAVLLATLLLAVLLSGIAPNDRLTWLMEAAPVLVGVPILIATRRRFPLSRLVYRLLFIHALLLTLGAHYTFSDVPLGLWVRDTLGLARNNFDRVVHFMGGVAPAILGREILRRKTPLRPGRWLFFLVALGCLGGSALYEILEWWAAAITGAPASAFLATQGDPWDTQWDMFLGLAGAVVGQLAFSRPLERELDRCEGAS